MPISGLHVLIHINLDHIEKHLKTFISTFLTQNPSSSVLPKQNNISQENALLTWSLSMTLHVCPKMLLQMRSYNFYCTTLSAEQQLCHMIKLNIITIAINS